MNIKCSSLFIVSFLDLCKDRLYFCLSVMTNEINHAFQSNNNYVKLTKFNSEVRGSLLLSKKTLKVKWCVK